MVREFAMWRLGGVFMILVSLSLCMIWSGQYVVLLLVAIQSEGTFANYEIPSSSWTVGRNKC